MFERPIKSRVISIHRLVSFEMKILKESELKRKGFKYVHNEIEFVCGLMHTANKFGQ